MSEQWSDDEKQRLEATANEAAKNIRASLDSVNRQLAAMGERFRAQLGASLLPDLSAMARFNTRAFLEPIARVAEEASRSMARQISQSLANIDLEAIEAARKGALPQNWWELSESETSVLDIVEVMRSTGWSLVWVPRAELVHDLVAAVDDDARVQALLGRATDVLYDVRATIEEVDHGRLVDNRVAALKACSAFLDGHFEAAQALAAVGISAIIHECFDMSFRKAHEAFDDEDPMSRPMRSFRLFLVLERVARCLDQYYPATDDPVPGVFSRHASAHSISPQQFTRLNSLASLLLLAGFLREVDLLFKRQDVADKERTEHS